MTYLAATIHDESIREFFDRLFGSPNELADEDLSALYDWLVHEGAPRETVRRLARAAADRYIARGEPIPEHVQSAL